VENKIKIFCSEDWSLDSTYKEEGYELLDTGGGEKLERFGQYVFIRPYEDAVWKKTLLEKEWGKADGKFWSSKEGAKSGWKMSRSNLDNKVEKRWGMSYKGIKFVASPTPFRHLGFFPEQASHWDFIETHLRQGFGGQEKIKFLNLFGYTGVASLFALRAGAEVTHVDASRQTLDLVKENQKMSGMDKMPMRIICDDVLKFLEREIKRGNKYDAVIMDPPKFGRGPKGETWRIEKDLLKLLERVGKVLTNKPLFVILTSYAINSSSLSLGYALENALSEIEGQVSSGELCVLEKSNNRVVSLANTAIWDGSF